MFSVFILRNIFIFIYLSLRHNLPCHMKDKVLARSHPPHPCAIHQMFTFFFDVGELLTAPPQMRPIRLRVCRLHVVMYIERDDIFNLFALVLMASALY